MYDYYMSIKIHFKNLNYILSIDFVRMRVCAQTHVTIQVWSQRTAWRSQYSQHSPLATTGPEDWPSAVRLGWLCPPNHLTRPQRKAQSVCVWGIRESDWKGRHPWGETMHRDQTWTHLGQSSLMDLLKYRNTKVAFSKGPGMQQSWGILIVQMI